MHDGKKLTADRPKGTLINDVYFDGGSVPVCVDGGSVPVCVDGGSVPVCVDGGSVPVCEDVMTKDAPE